MSMFHHLLFLGVYAKVCLFIPWTGSFSYQLFILKSFITYAECVGYESAVILLRDLFGARY